ncbi:MAG TPA: cyclic pyranopterin monophosphate synthase MoaC [Gammaproteobacteria bacterium]|nr:cyclic pyranopterin monophosphate synthase MoaC [Gammaproteobacteria bacterium]
MSKLTHFDKNGQAHMVDVAHKPISCRRAIAEGKIRMHADTLAKITSGHHKKGDVLAVARIAGIMASKRTAEMIPLCHPLPLNSVHIEFNLDESDACVKVTVTVETEAKTGVEIEALHAAQVALLTIYDMCKSVDRGMCIEAVRLVEKSGGQSGTWKAKSD